MNRGTTWMLVGAGLALAVGITNARAEGRLENVARKLTFKAELPEGKLDAEFFFTRVRGGKLYYWGIFSSRQPFTYEGNVLLRLTEKDGQVYLKAIRSDENLVLEGRFSRNTTEGSEVKDLVMSKAKLGKSLADKDGVVYWYEHELEGATEKPVSLRSTGPVFTADKRLQALQPLTVTGTLDFSGCDGCEHGDQFMLTGADKTAVNVVEVGFGRYHEVDCPGTPHAWLARLIELEIELTFVGQVTALSNDLWEGGFWTALKGGRLTFDRVGKVGVVEFLDSLPRDGKFTSYRDGVLVFRHARGEVRLYSRSGRVERS
jgi:hypothetical protein